MIKRITLLMVAALMAAMMMVATAAPAFANNRSDCTDGGGTWDNNTHTCDTPNGNPPTSSSPVRTVDDNHDAGNGETISSDRITPADLRG